MNQLENDPPKKEKSVFILGAKIVFAIATIVTIFNALQMQAGKIAADSMTGASETAQAAFRSNLLIAFTVMNVVQFILIVAVVAFILKINKDSE